MFKAAHHRPFRIYFPLCLCAAWSTITIYSTSCGAAGLDYESVAQAPQAAEVIRRAAIQREGITSGHVTCIRHMLTLNEGTGHLDLDYVAKDESWVLDDNLRTDTLNNVDPQTLAPSSASRRRVQVVRSNGENYDVEYLIGPHGNTDELRILDRVAFQRLPFQPWSPPEHGLQNLLRKGRATTFSELLQPLRSSVTVARVPQSKNLELIYELKDTKQKRKQKLIVDPSRDYVIVGYVSWGEDSEGVPWKSELSITYRFLPPGRYFADHTVYRTWLTRGTGLTLVREQDCQTTVASINEPIDKNLFEIRGLALPRGIVISDERAHANLSGKLKDGNQQEKGDSKSQTTQPHVSDATIP